MQEDVREVPLFPLNVVLFPGMALPLHIFEPRYRQMTRECLDTGAPMGIVLSIPHETLDGDEPARMGTLARICDYERLPDGRYNILAVGTERFEIVETHNDRPYITGLIHVVEDTPPADARNVDELAEEARDLLEEYLQLVMAQLGGGTLALDIPEPSEELSFLLASSLGCDDLEKQQLLEMTSVSERLAAGVRLLRKEIEALLRQGNSDPFPPLDDDRSILN